MIRPMICAILLALAASLAGLVPQIGIVVGAAAAGALAWAAAQQRRAPMLRPVRVRATRR